MTPAREELERQRLGLNEFFRMDLFAFHPSQVFAGPVMQTPSNGVPARRAGPEWTPGHSARRATRPFCSASSCAAQEYLVLSLLAVPVWLVAWWAFFAFRRQFAEKVFRLFFALHRSLSVSRQ